MVMANSWYYTELKVLFSIKKNFPIETLHFFQYLHISWIFWPYIGTFALASIPNSYILATLIILIAIYNIPFKQIVEEEFDETLPEIVTNLTFRSYYSPGTGIAFRFEGNKPVGFSLSQAFLDLSDSNAKDLIKALNIPEKKQI